MKISSVTILICTYNRGPLLRETLAAMQEMSRPSACAVDILVVDNNSTDNTADGRVISCIAASVSRSSGARL